MSLCLDQLTVDQLFNMTADDLSTMTAFCDSEPSGPFDIKATDTFTPGVQESDVYQ